MKATVVIGVNSGIGAALLEELAADYVIGVDRQQASASTRCTDYISLSGMEDVNFGSLKELLSEREIEIDQLIYLPGVNHMADFYTIERQQWREAFNVNIDYFLFLLKEMYPFFHRQVAIVCIASQNGVVAHEYRIDYSTSKAALIQLVKNLSVDFSADPEKDIKVNCVSPSYILTEKNSSFFESPFGEKLIQRIPYKKIPKVSDIVPSILFLLSPRSNAIRGQNIIIDYGYTIV